MTIIEPPSYCMLKGFVYTRSYLTMHFYLFQIAANKRANNATNS